MNPDHLKLWHKYRQALRDKVYNRREVGVLLSEDTGGQITNYSQLETAVNKELRSRFLQDYQKTRGGGDFGSRFDEYLAGRGIPAGTYTYKKAVQETEPFHPLAAAAQGLSFEFLDNILDKVGLSRAADYLREETEESYRQAPVSTFVSDIGSSLLTGGAALRGLRAATRGKDLPGAARTLLRGPTADVGTKYRVPQQIAREGVLGASGGALHYAGAEDEGDRGVAAVSGALLGGVGGAGLPALARGARFGFEALTKGGRGASARMASLLDEATGMKDKDMVLEALQQKPGIRQMYQDLEEKWPTIPEDNPAGAKVLRIIDKIALDDDVSSYRARGVAGRVAEAPYQADPSVKKLREIGEYLEQGSFERRAHGYDRLLKDVEEGLDLDLPPGAKLENMRLDPESDQGKALLAHLSQTDDPVMRRAVNVIHPGLVGKPAVPRPKEPGFEDVQQILFDLRKQRHPSARIYRADLEEAMNELDPQFAEVQKQWRNNETVIDIAQRAEGDWKGRDGHRKVMRQLAALEGDEFASDVYLQSVLRDIVYDLRVDNSKQAGAALQLLYSDSPRVWRAVENLYEEAFPGEGVSIANQLRMAGAREKKLDAVFRRMTAVTVGMAGGTAPRRSLVYTTVTGRVPIGAS